MELAAASRRNLAGHNSAMICDGLDEHYRDCVIGGLGAFMMPVQNRSHFAEAIRTKIIREIAGREPAARLMPAQAKASTNCSAVENLDWDRIPY